MLFILPPTPPVYFPRFIRARKTNIRQYTHVIRTPLFYNRLRSLLFEISPDVPTVNAMILNRQIKYVSRHTSMHYNIMYTLVQNFAQFVGRRINIYFIHQYTTPLSYIVLSMENKWKFISPQVFQYFETDRFYIYKK